MPKKLGHFKIFIFTTVETYFGVPGRVLPR